MWMVGYCTWLVEGTNVVRFTSRLVVINPTIYIFSRKNIYANRWVQISTNSQKSTKTICFEVKIQRSILPQDRGQKRQSSS